MSSALRSAAESTAQTLSDLVDSARDRIEDLPPIAHARRKRTAGRWRVVAIIGVVALVVVIIRRRQAAGATVSAAGFADDSRLAGS